MIYKIIKAIKWWVVKKKKYLKSKDKIVLKVNVKKKKLGQIFGSTYVFNLFVSK